MVLLASPNHKYCTNKNNWWTFTEEKHWRCMKHRVATQLYNSPSGYNRCCKWSATPVSLVMASSGALPKCTHAWTAVALHCYVDTGMLFVFKSFTFQHCPYLRWVPSTAVIEWYSVVRLCFVFNYQALLNTCIVPNAAHYWSWNFNVFRFFKFL